jgi:xanthine dehydrogenase/oxidase
VKFSKNYEEALSRFSKYRKDRMSRTPHPSYPSHPSHPSHPHPVPVAVVHVPVPVPVLAIPHPNFFPHFAQALPQQHGTPVGLQGFGRLQLNAGQVQSTPAGSAPVTQVNFTLNGNPVVIQNPDPNMSLNEYIRSLPGYTGTKLTCGEGGCGACTVTAQTFDATLNTNVTISLNSCLRPLCSVGGMSITTIEGIGGQQKGFHPIQERLADNNGTQCGFCSPGMVMSMYSLMQENPTPTAQEIEDGFDGNICRCTGYRPILSAMKSFASDAEEHHPKKNCSVAKNGTCCSKHFFADIEELCTPKYENKKIAPTKNAVCAPRKLTSKNQQTNVTWFTALTLTDLYSLLGQYATTQTAYKLVVGNTSAGVFKNVNPTVFIDIHNIPELKAAGVSSSGASFGAAVTITDAMNLLTQWNDNSPARASFPILAAHMKRIANHQVRNVASWAGNLMMVHDNADFPSDMCTILMAAGATLTISVKQTLQTGIAIADFLTMDMTGNVIVSVQIPFLAPNEVLLTYKVALRHQNSHALVNAGFRAVVNPSTNVISTQPTFVFGGIFPRAARVPKTETYLVGKTLTSQSTLQAVLSVLQQEATPDPGPGRVAYRNSLATALFYKFYVAILPASAVSAPISSIRTPYVRPVSNGIQSFQTNPAEYPVSQPVTKLKARLQTSGEVIYTGDIPELPNMLHAAFVTSNVAVAAIASVDFTPAMSSAGVFGYVTAADIPGQNNCSPSVPDQEILASKNVYYNGQAVALVLADTQRHANEAAKRVNATYANVQTPVLSLQQAIATNNIYPPNPQMPLPDPIVVGDVNQAFSQSANVLTGTVANGGQIHFHMETHSIVVIPQDDNQLLIYAATQNNSFLQTVVSEATGLPMNKITIVVKQLGGGYGGKIIKPNQIAAAAAVAALKFNRPVKVVLDINTNFEMIGRRHPIELDYKVGFSNTGLLNALQYTLYIDSGYAIDIGPGVLDTVFTTLDNNYYCPNWLIQGYAAKTNLPTNTSMRGPGWINAVFFMEYVLEHISSYLKLDPNQVRELNFYKPGAVTPYGQKLVYYNIPTMWETSKASMDYANRLAAVNQYNSQNRWSKKGISMTTVKFGIGWQGGQYGVLINVYADGTVNVNHGGIEIGQGVDTKVAQVIAYELGIPLSNIVITAPSTQILANQAATGGSVTSGLCSMAAINACGLLNGLLAPFKQQLGGNAPWSQVVAAAIGAGVDLQVKGWVNPGPSPTGGPYQYNSYAVACSEVLLDVLTGEYQIVRSDVLFDCGTSLNPAVDIGQVEGAFVQGIGLFMQEEILVDTNGALISNGTWEYKPPCSQDIPIDFRVTLLANAPNPLGVLSSKASGEPPLAAATCVFTAVRNAIQQARIASGNTDVALLDAPATVDSIQTACLVNINQFNF